MTRAVNWVFAVAVSGVVGLGAGCCLSVPSSPDLGTSDGVEVSPTVGIALGPIIEDDVSCLEAEVLYPAVQLQVDRGPWGTGVIIGFDGVTAQVLTAAHVVRDYDERFVNVFVLEPSPFSFEAVPIYIGQDSDLAVLEGVVPRGQVPAVARTLSLSTARVQRFEDVIGVGTMPGQAWLVPSAGIVSSVNPAPIATITAWFGASGGPVFVVRNGHWVVWGVISGIPMTQGHGVSSWVTTIVFITDVGTLLPATSTSTSISDGE